MKLKRPHRLKRWMKELLSECRLNPDNWHYVRDEPEELTISHRYTNTVRTIPLEGRRRKLGSIPNDTASCG